MSRAWIGVLVWATGCVGATTSKDATGHSAVDGACALLAGTDGCPSCYEGPYTCSYGGVTVSRGSCGDCTARAALYQALCDAGVAGSADEIEAGTVCAPTVCEVAYACSCEPTCRAADPGGSTATTAADAAPCSTCPTPIDPPGPCAWDGAACVFSATATP